MYKVVQVYKMQGYCIYALVSQVQATLWNKRIL